MLGDTREANARQDKTRQNNIRRGKAICCNINNIRQYKTTQDNTI